MPTSSYTYLVPAAELENSNQLQQGYETCAISTSASLANLARAEGFEPPSSALETDSLTLSLRPRFPQTNYQRAIKNPAQSRVRCVKNTLRLSRRLQRDALSHPSYEARTGGPGEYRNLAARIAIVSFYYSSK